MLKCESKECIQIGLYCFSDHAGDSESKNLPQLLSTKIGIELSLSNNSYHCSFVIRGIDMILNIRMMRSSKSSIHYIRS